jgi:hypothetical protein
MVSFVPGLFTPGKSALCRLDMMLEGPRDVLDAVEKAHAPDGNQPLLPR